MQEDIGQRKAAVIVQQQQRADQDQNESTENAAAARARAGHERLFSLPSDGTRRGAWRRPRNGRGQGWRGCGTDVTGHWGERRCEQYRSNDDQNERIGIRKIKGAAARFVQQKQHADGNNDGWPEQTTDSASWAATARVITHAMCLSSPQTIAEHHDAHYDQKHGPKLLDAPPGEPIKIVQQEQNAHTDD